MLRITVILSATFAVSGRNDETWNPPLVLTALPGPLDAPVLGSKLSIWLRPPESCSMMTALALPNPGKVAFSAVRVASAALRV